MGEGKEGKRERKLRQEEGEWRKGNVEGQERERSGYTYMYVSENYIPGVIISSANLQFFC